MMKIKLFVLIMILFALGALSVKFSLDSQAQSNQQTRATPTPAPTIAPKPTPSPVKDKDEDEVIRVNTELVTLTATVTDKNGRYRADLKRGDFTVYENGAEQKLEYFNTGDRVPVSLGIVFDTSGSMEDKIEGVRDAVEHFVKSVAPGDEIFLIQFSDDAELILDFTDDKRRILGAVENLEPQGSTALYDAVLLGLQKIRDGKHRKRALLLLTDGNDTASSTTFQEITALARKSEVIIYGLGIGHGEKGSSHSGVFDNQIKDTVDMRTLRALADATGGNAYYLENAHEGGRDLVDEAAEEVAKELKQQYTLGYYPTDKKDNGAFRQIKVELKDKLLRVRTKRGYYYKGDGRVSRNFYEFKRNVE
ncbi:MAG: VWA domain-containing protein [Acidobacteriota bacterium]|nr:VWA domain-containing protein [Acidobacteriota bacterium]